MIMKPTINEDNIQPADKLQCEQSPDITVDDRLHFFRRILSVTREEVVSSAVPSPAKRGRRPKRSSSPSGS